MHHPPALVPLFSILLGAAFAQGAVPIADNLGCMPGMSGMACATASAGASASATAIVADTAMGSSSMTTAPAILSVSSVMASGNATSTMTTVTAIPGSIGGISKPINATVPIQTGEASSARVSAKMVSLALAGVLGLFAFA